MCAEFIHCGKVLYMVIGHFTKLVLTLVWRPFF